MHTSIMCAAEFKITFFICLSKPREVHAARMVNLRYSRTSGSVIENQRD